MWEKVRLGDVCEVIAGQSPSSETYNQEKNGLPFFQGKADFGSIYPTVRYWCTSPIKISEPDDILFSLRAPVGPTNINNIQACIGRGLAAIRMSSRVILKYLLHFLRANEKLIAGMGSGSTFKAITIGTLKNLEIPLPPLPVQQRIADMLDKADTLRRKDQELLKKYDELAQAIFIDMFGDPVKNEKGWEVRKVIEHCDYIVPGRDKPKSFSGQIPWVTTDDLNHLSYTNKSRKNIGLTASEIAEVKAKKIPINSVIITCVGNLGICSINRTEIVINQQLHAFQPKDNFNPVFLMYNLSYRTDFMYKMASSTTVPYMNKSVCNSIPIIVPPIHLQQAFSQKIEFINQLNAKANAEKSEELFQVLLQKAFKGYDTKRCEQIFAK